MKPTIYIVRNSETCEILLVENAPGEVLTASDIARADGNPIPVNGETFERLRQYKRRVPGPPRPPRYDRPRGYA